MFSSSDEELNVENFYNNSENLWLNTMNECMNNSSVKLNKSKQLLVLGVDDAGKTELVTRLQGYNLKDKTKSEHGLVYNFINIREDEYLDENIRLGVWMLDEDPFYQNLLKHVLNEDTITHTTVLLIAPMTKPWYIIENLSYWVEVLKKHIDTLDLTASFYRQRKTKILKSYKTYLEPCVEPTEQNLVENLMEKDINLAVDLNIVITKTEYMKVLQSEFAYEDKRFDVLQMNLRKFCLCHSASLVYISVKENKNCEILKSYLLNKIYGFPFRALPNILDQDLIFVPVGWDSDSKLQFLSKMIGAIPDSTLPKDARLRRDRPLESSSHDVEVTAEDDETFLISIQRALERQGSEGNHQVFSKMSSSSAVTEKRKKYDKDFKIHPQKCTPVKEYASSGGSEVSDSTIGAFFQKLLKKKQHSSLYSSRKLAVENELDSDTTSKDVVYTCEGAAKNKFRESLYPLNTQNIKDTGDNAIQKRLPHKAKVGDRYDELNKFGTGELSPVEPGKEYRNQLSARIEQEGSFCSSKEKSLINKKNTFPRDNITGSFNPFLKNILETEKEGKRN